MFRGHNSIGYGGLRNFLYKNGVYKLFCNVIRFRGNQKYRKHVHGDDIQGALALQLLYFDFMMKQHIRINPDV